MHNMIRMYVASPFLYVYKSTSLCTIKEVLIQKYNEKNKDMWLVQTYKELIKGTTKDTTFKKRQKAHLLNWV